MKTRAVLLVAALALVLAACGSTSDVGSGPSTTATSSTAPVSTTTLAHVADSDYLGKVVANELRNAAMVPTESGLLVLGGATEGYEQPIAPVRDAVVVHADGTVGVLPPPPGVALASVSASADGDTVYVVGTRCTSGKLNGDTSALHCEPGTPALFRFDLATSRWTELDRPDDAPAPGGFVGDQAVYALDGAVVYQVKDAIGPDGRLTAWITDDDAETWKPMPPEPSGAFCAADGKLLRVLAGDQQPAPDGNGVTTMTDTPDRPLDVTVQTFAVDEMTWGPVTKAPGDFPVVGGATSVSCLPDTGAAAFTLTGGTSGAVVVYSVKDGWSVVHDDEGARMMSTVPSFGSGVLLSPMGEGDLVRIDESGKRNTVALPASSQPIAGIGDAVLVRNADGEPEVVDAEP